MVVGIIVGASIFVQPSVVTARMPTAGGALLVWCVAGALTLLGSLVTAELASAWPRSGGVYVFLRDGYSPALGFLWGWAMFWSMHSGIVAAIAVVAARYVGTWIPLGDAGTRAVAIAAIGALTGVNVLGVRQGSAVQAALTCVKVLAVVLIVAVGFIAHPRAAPANAPDGSATPSAFVAALVAGLFAYGGWHMVSYAAEETVDAARTIPRALLVGTVAVTALYVGVNAAYLRVLPLGTLRGSTRVVADFADATLGGAGAQIMAALVVLSALGAMNGVILAGPRVYLAMARDGLLFRRLGTVHARFRTPHVALVAQAVWSSVLVATGSYRALFTRVVYTEWIFFGLMAASLLWLRRRPDYRPVFRAWGGAATPVVFAAASLVIVAMQLVDQPRDGAIGLLLVLVGLPVYWIRGRAPSHDSSTETSPRAVLVDEGP
ncbi:amino acid permease-associated region [Gemmatirosa kalamazoonensis]|uniref:Amino acid permease-associated region n=2 Tax=Gemmatirosa kalamazoonensis TaxID=861299 RepID=W0REZ1_9BACT|nr:amino acid permease-associated region [Gemmatirosa kalamazoonensis]